MAHVSICHSSLEVFDPRWQRVEDLERTFQRGADLVGFTEVTKAFFDGPLKKAAHHYGYTLHSFGADTCIAARHLTTRVRRAGKRKVLKPRRIPLFKGGHNARHISWVVADVTKKGKTVRVGYATTHHLAKLWKWKWRWRAHNKHTRLLARISVRLWEKRKCDGVFVSSDFNRVPGKKVRPYRTEKILRKRRLHSVWDQFGPIPTHGKRAIDWILHRRSKTTRLVSIKVCRKQHKDHRDVVAVYNVEAR